MTKKIDKNKKTEADLLEEKKKKSKVAEDKDTDEDEEDEDDEDEDDSDDVVQKDDGEEEDDEEEDDEDEDDDVKKENKEVKKSRLVQSYLEKDQPPVETVATEPGKAKANKDEEVAENAIENLFSGENLSEDFKSKAITVFEAAVTFKAKERTKAFHERVKAIEDAADKAVEEQVEAIKESINSKVDDYLGYIVLEWLEANKLAIDNSLKLEIYENFFNSVKESFISNNINIPEDAVDMFEESKKENAELKEENNGLVEKLIAKEKEILEMKKSETVSEMTEGLTDVQADKFRKLVEDVEARDLETFKEKVATIKENFFKVQETTSKKQPTLEESVTEKISSPDVEKYVKSLERFSKK